LKNIKNNIINTTENIYEKFIDLELENKKVYRKTEEANKIKNMIYEFKNGTFDSDLVPHYNNLFFTFRDIMIKNNKINTNEKISKVLDKYRSKSSENIKVDNKENVDNNKDNKTERYTDDDIKSFELKYIAKLLNEDYKDDEFTKEYNERLVNRKYDLHTIADFFNTTYKTMNEHLYDLFYKYNT